MNYIWTLVKTVILVLGLSLCAVSAHSEDISALEANLKANSQDHKTRVKVATFYYNKKQFKKVIRLLDPYSASISHRGLFVLANSFSKTKAYSDEARVLKILIGNKPNNKTLHLKLGRAYFNNNKTKPAIESLRKAIQLDPKLLPAYETLLEVFKKKNDLYESRLIATDMIKNFGKKPKFYKELCRIYTQDAFLSEAIVTCQEAIQLDHNEPENHAYLSQAYQDRGEKKAAERIIKTAAKKFTRSDVVQLQAGRFYFQEKNFGVASRYYSAAVKANKKSAEAQLGMARSMFEIGKFKESLPGFNMACKLDQSTLKYFREASAKLRLSGNRKWEKKFYSKLYSCR